MPTLPAALADRTERWFGKPATVTAVDQLSPGLRRVTFLVDALRGRTWTPGHEIEIRVGPRELRHYTPESLDPDTGTLTVLFALHADGPGTGHVRAIDVDDRIDLLGPGGGLRRRDGHRELFLGDATAVGLFRSLLPTARTVVGAVEVPAADATAAAGLLPQLDVVAADAEPGTALDRWLADRLGDLDVDRACLVGHAGTVQRQRAVLRGAGLARSAVTVKAYWATGKRGL